MVCWWRLAVGLVTSQLHLVGLLVASLLYLKVCCDVGSVHKQ